MTANGSSNKWIGKRTPRPDGADKVTGRAAFGADFSQPGMLVGKVLRSPHPHARIRSINLDKAAALPGVKAVMTSKDLVEFPWDKPAILGIQDLRFNSRNVMARDKALYAGHAVAAVAATSASIASRALKLIEVDYEVLPWVIDVDEAMQPGAPILHAHMHAAAPKGPATTSNVAGKLEHTLGNIEAGFAAAEVVVERSFKTKPVHQGYIEPHACLVTVNKDGQVTIWSSSQGHFMVRDMTGQLTGTQAQRHSRDPRRDRRRVRRQDDRLSRAVGAGPGEEVRTSRQDGDVARGGVSRHGPDVRVVEHSQDRRDQGRQDHRREGDV